MNKEQRAEFRKALKAEMKRLGTNFVPAIFCQTSEQYAIYLKTLNYKTN